MPQGDQREQSSAILVSHGADCPSPSSSSPPSAPPLQLYRKVSGQVVSKEHEAYEERQRSGLHKPILRAKLVDKIKEFVSGSVRRIKQLPSVPGAAVAHTGGGGEWV